MSETLFFLVFSVAVVFVMLVDLGVFKKSDAEEVSFREAGFWSGAWVLLAIIFYIFLGFNGSLVHGIQDVTGLRAVQQAYAPHIDLGTGSYFDQLAVFKTICL